MFPSSIPKAHLALGLALLGTISLLAQTTTTKKPSPPPAKPAAKPAASAAKPSGGTSTTTAPPTTTHTGPTANSTPTTHPSPTANRPTANAPSTAHPTAALTSGAKPAARPAIAEARPVSSPHPTIDHGHPIPRGIQAHELKGGNAIARRPGGGIRDVHDAQRGIDIHHGLAGGRRISIVRADHSRLVAERGRPGFIEHPYGFGGHDYTRRTYYDHGHIYDRFYRAAYVHGVAINVYAPVRYYSVGFYGWAYHPWGAPVVYAWGWGRSPWVGYYGFYFAPYPVYASPSLWLTDYMISSDLQAAYEVGQANGAMQAQSVVNAPPMLTPEVKAEIAQEVQNQIALENTEAQSQAPDPASSGIARMLGDGHPHVFVAGSALDVMDASGAECMLSDGDALQLSSPPPPDATSASLIVLASKGGNECAKSVTVTVALDDLQEMQNHMRETIDLGLEQLHQNQGKGGIPAAPPSAVTPPTNSSFTALAPPPDPNGAMEISLQEKDADQSEQEVTVQEKQEAGG